MRSLALSWRRWLPLALVVAALAACGGSPNVPPVVGLTPIGTPLPTIAVAQVSASKTVPDGGTGNTVYGKCLDGDPALNNNCGVTVTATCPNHEPLLSGGYKATAGYVVSNFPSSPSSWTVSVHNDGPSGGGPVTLSVYADCLQGNIALKTRVVQVTQPLPGGWSPQSFSVSCPARTSLTGGGFQGSSGNSVSMPFDNGWQVELSMPYGINASVFAVCASGSVIPGALPAAPSILIGTSPADLTVGCPGGQYLVGGGYSETGYAGGALADQAAPDFSQWHVTAQPATGPGIVLTPVETAYAVCLAIAPSSSTPTP